MRRNSSALIALAALTALGGCADYATRQFGVQRGAQDQTRVTSPPPLSLPPILAERGLGSASAADQAGAAAQADSAGKNARPPSPGEDALLQDAGPSAPNDIRQRIDQDAQLGHADPSLSNEILYGQPGQQPVIQRASKSWFDRIF